MQVKKQQLELDIEQWTGSKLGKEYVKAYAGLEEAHAGIKFAGRIINNLRYADTPPLWQKVKRKERIS